MRCGYHNMKEYYFIHMEYRTSNEIPLYSIRPSQYDAVFFFVPSSVLLPLQLFFNLPAIALSKEVLPQPGGPMTRYVLPGFNTNEICLRMYFSS